MTSATLFLLMLLLVADTTFSHTEKIKLERCKRFLLETQEIFCKHLPLKDDTTGTQWKLIQWPWSPPEMREKHIAMLISRCCNVEPRRKCTFDEVMGYC